MTGTQPSNVAAFWKGGRLRRIIVQDQNIHTGKWEDRCEIAVMGDEKCDLALAEFLGLSNVLMGRSRNDAWSWSATETLEDGRYKP